jgi:hypothetical protein
MRINSLALSIPEDHPVFRPVRKVRSLVQWARQVNYTIDGNVFNLNKVPYSKAIYADDKATTYVFRKGSQVAITSWALAKAMHGADELGMRWIYFLPTDTEMDDFVADRVGGVIENSKYLRSRVGSTDNSGLKKIGDQGGLLYFRGLWTRRHAKSVPADGLIFDEVDEINPELIAFGEDRVLASAWQTKVYLSVPSFSDIGIDKLFKDSDQRFYLIKCKQCNTYASIDEDFPKNFIPVPESTKKLFPSGAKYYHGCLNCGAELVVKDGEWVAKHPGAPRRGYHVSRLIQEKHPPDFANSATYLMDEFKRAHGSQVRMSRFTIAFQGMPFDGEGARLTEELLDSLEVKDEGWRYSGSGMFLGCDQGDMLDIGIFCRVGEKLQLIYCENTQEWDRLDMLMERYGIVMAGVDGNPNRHNAKKFAAKWKKRAFIQDFTGDKIQDKVTMHEGKTEVRWVTTERTQSLDATVDFVESGRLMLPDRRILTGRDLTMYERFRLHVRNLKSKLETPLTGAAPRRVYLRNVPNHQGMALNTARIAAFELGVRRPLTGTAPQFIKWGNA